MVRYTAPAMERPSRVLAWMEPAQLELLRQTIRATGFELVGVGCDERSDANDLADALDVPASADLRHALERDHQSIDLLWLLAGSPLDDPIREVIRRTGMRTITSEPRPQSINDVARDPALADLFTFVPQMAFSDGFMAARALLEELGVVRCVNVSFTAPPAAGSLHARLYDALHVITTLCGDAMAVHAATGNSATEGDALPHQWLSANVMFPGGQAAVLTVRCGTGPWARRLIAIGDHGMLDIDDTTCRWLERSDEPDHRGPSVTVGELVARQLRRMRQHHERLDPPVNASNLLALCEAAWLSCRTGQVEAPGRMIEAMTRI